jgi:hypothetical protein
VVSLAKTFVVNYDISAGSVLDSFSFFNSSVSAVDNVTISSVGPATTNFAVQLTGPNSGRWRVRVGTDRMRGEGGGRGRRRRGNGRR